MRLRLLSLLAPERARLALALLFTLCSAALTALFTRATGALLSLVSGAPFHPEGALAEALSRLAPAEARLEGLATALAGPLLALAAGKAIAQFGAGTLMQRAALAVSASLRRDLYAKLLALPPAFFQDKHSAELFTRFSSDVTQVEQALAQGLVAYVKDACTALALLVLCALVDARLLFWLVVAVPAAALPISRFAKRLKRQATRSQGALGKTTERVSEVIANVRVVQAYRQQAAELARFDAAQATYLGEMRRSFFVRAAFTPILELLGVAGLSLALLAAVPAVQSGALSADHLLTFLVAAMQLYQPIKSISSTGQAVVAASASAERLFEVLDADARPDAPGAQPLPAFSQSVRFEGVRFAYGPDQREVLTGLDLELKQGERVALVGPSGGGKSTAAALLLGFWRPTGGRLLVDGRDLGQATLQSWREQVALVTQEPVLFQGTVAENLRLGRPGASLEELREAARAAGALAFVEALPGGFEAPVGERGCLLSGGQRQRLVLARALLRAAPVLVLDEATSSLDVESERLVEAGLAQLLTGRTALIIAHRLSTVRSADRIAVLEGGRVAELGTHAELLARGGLYARLWQSFVGAAEPVAGPTTGPAPAA